MDHGSEAMLSGERPVLPQSPIGEANLSTGIYTSFKQLVGEIANCAHGSTPEVVGMSDTPEGVFARGGCIKKQRSRGFVPKIEIRDGIERALNLLGASKS